MLAITDILEERSVETLYGYNNENYREVIINYNDVNIRDIYAKVLAKGIKYGFKTKDIEITTKAREILLSLLAWIRDETFAKNLHKTYQYFELIKDLITNNA